jgi:AcrR family transcriptional regulator
MARAPKLDTQIRQEQILEAALAIISERGLKGLSLGGTARRIGVVPSAIYRHFASKEALLTALIDVIELRLGENVKAVCEQTEQAFERLQLLLERHVVLIRQNQGIPRVVFSAEVAGGSPTHRRRVHRVVTGYLERISQIIQEGQRRGHIRADLNPDVTALLFLGIIQPAAFLWNLSDGGFDVTRHTRQAWEIFQRAVAVS